MSVLGYAAMTNSRDLSAPGKTFADSPETTDTNSKKKYIDALAALVPAEVLGVHAVVLAYTTKTENKVFTITDPDMLYGAFWGLCVLSLVLYVVPRVVGGRWDIWDFARMAIPVAAFVLWTMLQTNSAFDVVAPAFTQSQRAVPAVLAAVALGVFAAALAYSVDQKSKPKR